MVNWPHSKMDAFNRSLCRNHSGTRFFFLCWKQPMRMANARSGLLLSAEDSDGCKMASGRSTVRMFYRTKECIRSRKPQQPMDPACYGSEPKEVLDGCSTENGRTTERAQSF